MRYELSDYEWTAIKPMLPNKPRGVPRLNDRRVLNGIFWVLRSGAPWRDLPLTYGPRTTCCNRCSVAAGAFEDGEVVVIGDEPANTINNRRRLRLLCRGAKEITHRAEAACG